MPIIVSSSTLPVVATANVDGCPFIEITVSVPETAQTVTVYRYVEGNRTTVRGGVRTLVAGSILIVDYEAPLGVPIQYTVVSYDEDGVPSEESSPSAAVTLVATDAWISDPLDPTTCTKLFLACDFPMLIPPTMDSFTYDADVQVIPTLGNRVPVGRATQRQVASGINITIVTGDQDQDDQFRELFLSAFPVLLRLPFRNPLGGATYLAPTGMVEQPIIPLLTNALRGAPEYHSAWRITADVVRPPGIPTVVNVRTWDEAQQDAVDWNGIVSLYSSWIDFQRGT